MLGFFTPSKESHPYAIVDSQGKVWNTFRTEAIAHFALRRLQNAGDESLLGLRIKKR
jgi:streptogramin lyase